VARGTLVLALALLAFAVPSTAEEIPTRRDGFVCPPCGCDQHGIVFAAAGPCPGCGMALVALEDQRAVAILVYPGVELLDFAGPGEVFAATGKFHVYTVSVDGEPVLSQGFVTVDPQFSIADAPAPDILIIPGGGIRNVLENAGLMAWIRSAAGTADHVLTVCTGAFALAEAGLLDGLRATTHHGSIDHLREKAPRTEVLEGVRFVDNGKFVTSAGVSAGIDMSLHVVGGLLGEETAVRTARYMEYAWSPREETED